MGTNYVQEENISIISQAMNDISDVILLKIDTLKLQRLHNA